jgi:O-antigen ligase
MIQGRFVSFQNTATGLSAALAPLAVTLFWRAMEEKGTQISSFFAIAALVSFALILWSGSRSPSGATLMGVCMLWWYFRSRLLLAMLLLAVLGVIGQLVLSGFTGDIAFLLDRVESANTAEGGRTDIWVALIEIAARSPVYGFSPSGLSFAMIGGVLGDYLAGHGVEFETRGIHNSFLGITMRFGLGGLTLFLAMLVSAMIRARQVLFSEKIPDAEKRIYILPAVLMPVIAFTMMFEDLIPGSGKGTVQGLLLYASIVICHTYGSKLVNLYERMDGKSKLIHTVEGLKVATQPSVNT